MSLTVNRISVLPGLQALILAAVLAAPPAWGQRPTSRAKDRADIAAGERAWG